MNSLTFIKYYIVDALKPMFPKVFYGNPLAQVKRVPVSLDNEKVEAQHLKNFNDVNFFGQKGSCR